MEKLVAIATFNQHKEAMNYKKLLIQQQTFDGTNYRNVGPVIDTQASFNVVCQEFPFKYLPESKELAKRDWSDEHGDDVYIPTDGLKFKAYDTDVKFLFVGTENNMHDQIASFIKFIYGRNDGGSPLLAVYDEYTKIGRRGVIVDSISEDMYGYDDANNNAIAIFKVKFRVTDPVTDITLTI